MKDKAPIYEIHNGIYRIPQKISAVTQAGQHWQKKWVGKTVDLPTGNGLR